MDFIDYFVPLAIGVFLGVCSTYQYMENKKNTSIQKVNEESHIPLKLLINIEDDLKKLDIDKYSKERLLKCIDFEIYMIRADIYKNLGKQEYERKMNEEKNENTRKIK